MFVADLPPDLPPAYIKSVCNENSVNLNDVDYKNLTVEKLLEITSSVGVLNKNKEEGLRLKILKKVGFVFGVQGGYYQRVKDIKHFLKNQENNIDRVFNFQALMLFDGRVVPPVIGSARNTYNQEDSDTIHLSSLNFNIVEQARFSPVSPNWRNYLYFKNAQVPRVPDGSVLPKGSMEKDAWEKSIRSGWVSGRCQADKSYALNISKLRRDYIGMVRYHILMRRGIVSKPFVAKTKERIKGDKNGIKIGDRLLRITAKPGFQLDEKEWDALIQQVPFYKDKGILYGSFGKPTIRVSKKQGDTAKEKDKSVVKSIEVNDKERLSVDSLLKGYKDRFSGSGMVNKKTVTHRR